MAYDAVVLAGGSGTRLGGVDKAELVVGGERLLDRVLAACAGARTVVVVGPERSVRRPVRWAREEPPGGGPLAGLAAGLEALGTVAGGSASEAVVVLAVDLPHLGRGEVERLVDALGGAVEELARSREAPAGSDGRSSPDRTAPSGPVDGAAEAAGGDEDGGAAEAACLVDASGRRQPLVAAYLAGPLRAAVAAAAPHAGRPLTPAVRGLRTVEVTAGRASDDVDTADELAAARARSGARS